jgi:hypothetical protein
MVWRRAVLFAVVLLMPVPGKVVGETATSEQLWADFNPSRWVTERVNLFGDVGARSEFADDGWWRFVVRPGVEVPVHAFRVTAGVGNFFTFNEVIADRWELRPFQGVAAVWPNGRIALDHYVRLEERFDFNTETWESLNSLRIRYQLGFTYHWSALQVERSWAIISSVEPFFTLAGNQGQQREQVRATLGVERTFSRHRRIRLELSWQQQQLFFNTNDHVSEFFFRFRFYGRWQGSRAITRSPVSIDKRPTGRSSFR